ncbi:MAG TPA: hypothetical protein VD926_07610 [Acidimicrobiales bacterium]|nr:hypothetical protein [Acidimicrobiales bacterium]
MTDPGVPWYRRVGLLAVLALVVLVGGLAVGLALAAGDDEDGDSVATEGTTTTPTVASTTTLPPATTAAPAPTTTAEASAEERCAAGDQLACDELSDERLDELCDGGDGNVDACQVLLARQGDGVPDGPNGEGNGNGNANGNGRGNGNGNDDDDGDD